MTQNGDTDRAADTGSDVAPLAGTAGAERSRSDDDEGSGGVVANVGSSLAVPVIHDLVDDRGTQPQSDPNLTGSPDGYAGGGPTGAEPD